MGKLKQLMIEEMDMAVDTVFASNGVTFTKHCTDHLGWGEIPHFIARLRDYYKLLDREIIEVNSYHNSGWDFLSDAQAKPAENGIEIKWRESNVQRI